MKTIVITGISRGIGKATAELFLKQGWQVIGSSTSGQCPVQHDHLRVLPLHLEDTAQVADFISHCPDIDVLVNNAAILKDPYDRPEIDIDLLKETFAINTFGAIALTEQCISKLKPYGQIINITSGWGAFSSNDSPYQPHYKMSKASLNMYTLLLAERLPHICVSSFDPGWVKTDMGTEEAPTRPETTAQEIFDLVHRDKDSGCFWLHGHKRAF